MASRLRSRAGLAAGRALRALPGERGSEHWRLVAARALLGRERTIAGASPLRALQLVRQGFLPRSRVLYDLDRNDPREFLSDRARERTHWINGPARRLLDDKLAFYLVLARAGIPTPPVRGIVVGGVAHPFGEQAAPGWLRERLDAGHGLVLRPRRGRHGAGVLLVRRAQDGAYRVNGEPLAWDGVEARLRRLPDHVVTDFVEQHAYAREVFAGSTNTVRALTMVDPASGAPFIAQVVHRFGVAASAPVDNCSLGALSCKVDIADGHIGRGACVTSSSRLIWHHVHPETGAAIDGLVVPRWEEVRIALLEAVTRLPFLLYVGWDVVVTDSGVQFIEGNASTDVEGQFHGPLLRDPRVRAFYAAHGIV